MAPAGEPSVLVAACPLGDDGGAGRTRGFGEGVNSGSAFREHPPCIKDCVGFCFSSLLAPHTHTSPSGHAEGPRRCLLHSQQGLYPRVLRGKACPCSEQPRPRTTWSQGSEVGPGGLGEVHGPPPEQSQSAWGDRIQGRLSRPPVLKPTKPKSPRDLCPQAPLPWTQLLGDCVRVLYAPNLLALHRAQIQGHQQHR